MLATKMPNSYTIHITIYYRSKKACQPIMKNIQPTAEKSNCTNVLYKYTFRMIEDSDPVPSRITSDNTKAVKDIDMDFSNAKYIEC